MPREQAAAREGLREAVVIPAMSGGEVLAVVELLSAEQGELEERLMRSLTGIGYELGQFLARRRGELEPAVLTPREIEVLELAAQGLSARRSAERLGVSAATVRTHLENIYAKLGVTDKASAVADALRQGLIR
jgi:DNA-binding CsgD family transcriptional regulator